MAKEQAEIVWAVSEPMPDYYFGRMRLLVTTDAVDMSRLTSPAGLAFLSGHDSNQPVGMVERSQILNGVAYASVRLESTERSEPFLQEIRAGIRVGVSPGFQIFESDIVDADDGGVELLITSWAPVEISAVPVPRMKDASVLSVSGSPKEKASVPERPVERPAARMVDRPAARPVATVKASQVDQQARRVRPTRTLTREDRMDKLAEMERRVDAKLGQLSAAGDGKPETGEPMSMDAAITGLLRLSQNPSGVTPDLPGVELQGVRPNHATARVRSMTAALVASDVSGSEITSVERGDIQPTGRSAERLLSVCRPASIPYGSTRFPVLTTSPTAGMVADGAAPLTIVDAVFDSTPPEATFHAAQVRASFSLQSALQGGDVFRSMVDDSIRAAMFALQARQLIDGSGVAPNVRGILNVAGIGTSNYATTDRGSAGTFRAAEDALDLAGYGAETRRVWLLSPSMYQTARRTIREPGNSDYVVSRGVVLDEVPALKVEGLSDNQGLLIDGAYLVFAVFDRSDLILDGITWPGVLKVTLTVGIDVVPIRENSIVLLDQA